MFDPAGGHRGPFATAWSPPGAWLGFVSRSHPGLVLRHEFCEEMGHFAGRGVWRVGELVEQESLNPEEVEWMEWEEVEEE